VCSKNKYKECEVVCMLAETYKHNQTLLQPKFTFLTSVVLAVFG